MQSERRNLCFEQTDSSYGRSDKAPRFVMQRAAPACRRSGNIFTLDEQTPPTVDLRRLRAQSSESSRGHAHKPFCFALAHADENCAALCAVGLIGEL
jgi:hypothetical protein